MIGEQPRIRIPASVDELLGAETFDGWNEGIIEPGDRPAVLVVDLQYAFTDPESPVGGSPYVEAATRQTARLLVAARRAGVPVFHSAVAYRDDRDLGLQRIKNPLCAAIKPGTRWAQVDERVWDPSDVLIVKRTPSFFHSTPLHSLLTAQGVDTVVITGVNTSGCIRATIVDAFSNGFRAIVPHDCVGDEELEPHIANLRDVRRRYAEIVDADAVQEYFATFPRV